MTTYKLFRLKKDGLYPLYVLSGKATPMGEWVEAEVGEKLDDTHVKARSMGRLSLRPGWHSTRVPYTDWIGKRQPDGSLYRRPDEVWCECEVKGKQLNITDRYGSRELLDGWYYFKTNPKQEEPWVISRWLKVDRILTDVEVSEICKGFGYEAQPVSE